MGLFGGLIGGLFGGGIGGGQKPRGPDPAVKREGELSLARAEGRSWEDRIRRMGEGRDKARAHFRLADVFGGGDGTKTPAVDYGALQRTMPGGSAPFGALLGSARGGGLLGSAPFRGLLGTLVSGRPLGTLVSGRPAAPTGAEYGRTMPGDWDSADVPSDLDEIASWAKARFSPYLDARRIEKEAYDAARAGLPDTGRPEYYGAIGDAFRASATRDLDEQHAEAQRRLRFNLARRGLTGGSADAHAHGRIAKRKSDAALDVGSRARSAELGAAQGDEQLRGRLAGLIEAGHSPGDVLRQARAGLGANYAAAMAEADRAALGEVFGGIGGAFEQAPSFALLESLRGGGGRRGGRWWGGPAPGMGGRVS